MRQHFFDWWIVYAIVALFAAVVLFAVWDSKRFQLYAEEHHCVPTGQTKTWTTIQCIQIGQNPCHPMLIERQNHQYQCDGGEVLWR